MIRRFLVAVLALVTLLGAAAPVGSAAAAGRGGSITVPTGSPRFAAVTTNAITVLQNSARSEFPKQLDFSLQAQSTSQISSIRIAYQVGDDPVTSIARVVFTPANRVDTTYRIDLGQEYYPPGVTIQYQWRIEDQTGAKLSTDWATLNVSDPRFSWHARTLGLVTVHWYDGDDQFADSVLTSATKALSLASATARVSTIKPVQIFLYGNPQDFRTAMGTNVDEWVGGQTYPLYRLVVLLTPPDDVVSAERSVAHEMTHVAIDSTAEDPFGPLPTWLDEGMAVVAEGPLDPAFRQALDQAVQSRTLMSIQSISGNFPSSTDGATLAYAESASLVSYFVRSNGQAKLSSLVAAFRRGDTSDEAFQQTIGMTTLDFQHRWEASLQSQASGPATASAPTPQKSPNSLVSVLMTPVTFVISILGDIVHLLQAAKG